jgi:PhzF family phenazine biosynthesis protein
MSLTIIQVDAFTNQPFAGNPAAVCLLAEARDERWLQQVAAEMNLSETAFLESQADGFNLRWFTPVIEVDLCGHATLASAHVLWETGRLAPDAEARFHTRSGLLTARRQGDWIELDFPAKLVSPASAPPGLVEALGVTPLFVGRNSFDYLVEVATAAEVRAMQPNFSLLRSVECRGVMVTSPGDTPEYDFISRFFAPGAGIDEDPVTGSAHCGLTPYWAEKLGKPEMVAFQASARGGVVRVRLSGDRVKLGGQAVTVLRGELMTEA